MEDGDLSDGIGHLKLEDDAPDEAEDDVLVAIADVLCANVDQFQPSFLAERFQHSTDVLHVLHAHSGVGAGFQSGGLGDELLHQMHQDNAGGEVGEQIVDFLRWNEVAQLVVQPCGEGVLLGIGPIDRLPCLRGRSPGGKFRGSVGGGL